MHSVTMGADICAKIPLSRVSGCSEGRWLHDGGELAAVGYGTSGRAGTSRRWDAFPQLLSKGEQHLCWEPRSDTAVLQPGVAGQGCGDQGSGWGSGSVRKWLPDLVPGYHRPAVELVPTTHTLALWGRNVLRNLSFDFRGRITILHVCQKSLKIADYFHLCKIERIKMLEYVPEDTSWILFCIF